MWQIWFWCFLLFTVYFARIPHPTIVLHCNLLTRDIFLHFIIYFVSSTVSQFHPYFIMNSLYLQGSLKYQTWLHYPIILKVNLWKRFISFWHRKIPGKVTIWTKLGRPCPISVISFIYPVVVVIYLMYILKIYPYGCR